MNGLITIINDLLALFLANTLLAVILLQPCSIESFCMGVLCFYTNFLFFLGQRT